MLQVVLTVVRVLVGAFFILTGVAKFTMYDVELELFRRWGVPFPELFVYFNGVIEVAFGLFLVLGVAVAVSTIPLIAMMVGALLTAGRIDGGFHAVAPPTLIVLMALLFLFGGGRWQLWPSPFRGLLAGRGQSRTLTGPDAVA